MRETYRRSKMTDVLNFRSGSRRPTGELGGRPVAFQGVARDTNAQPDGQGTDTCLVPDGVELPTLRPTTRRGAAIEQRDSQPSTG
jgi:hypothetical protein